MTTHDDIARRAGLGIGEPKSAEPRTIKEIIARMREVADPYGYPWGEVIRIWADELERATDELRKLL